MQIPDTLRCLFSASVTEQRDSYVIEIPKSEITTGNIQEDGVYRVGLFETETTPDEDSTQRPEEDTLEPPVSEGETRTVDIEGLGEQGDGVARVERGYVIIVPDTEKGERVTIELTDVTETVAFAEVIEREDYYL
ncbi:TRAM domain-containing protein [Natronolimnobius sp. AArcel1]|uniref:TRAM domain-containing protein n=1 Tax=Natronolimnobius sp. AArcel1 TaxID=1679093 RepID=UPI0013E9E68D|nr:TRAM domain-containing protein [Natronolimnobius sp. AArcel1]NGM70399.1 TRAM domain-containing protein [Natronolimnobius sp. AArcel1]